ncbi:MAG: hypothetical protein ACKV2Q_19250 [Planctomycetaceae bacterium]
MKPQTPTCPGCGCDDLRHEARALIVRIGERGGWRLSDHAT